MHVQDLWSEHVQGWTCLSGCAHVNVLQTVRVCYLMAARFSPVFGIAVFDLAKTASSLTTLFYGSNVAFVT